MNDCFSRGLTCNTPHDCNRSGCQRKTLGMDPVDHASGRRLLEPLGDAVQLMQAAGDLVRAAARLGLVLTIEQRPLRPFAMGHYTTTVHVRKARPTA